MPSGGSPRTRAEKKPFHWPFYYGWVIVVIAFLSMGTWLAMRTTFSVFLVALLDEFHWSRASAAGVQSVSFIVYTLSAPLVGALIDRFGPRKVILPGIIVLSAGLFICASLRSLMEFYFFYGVLVAFGVTFVSIIAYSAVLSHWFQRRRGLASGIAVSGMGIGSFALVPLTQYVIIALGWRSAFKALAGVVFLLLFPLTALFLRHKPSDLGLEVDGTGAATRPTRRSMEVVDHEWARTDWTLRLASREGRFWSVLVFSFLVIVPIYLIVIHGVRLLTDCGFDRMRAAFMIAGLGVFTSPSQIFWGWLSDRVGRERTFTMGTLFVVLGALCLLLTDWGHPAFAYLFVPFFGCGWAVTAPTFMSVAADLFQGRSFGLIYGVNEAVIGLGSAVGPWLGGFVFDRTGSYQNALLIAIASGLCSLPFAWLAAPRKVRQPGGRR